MLANQKKRVAIVVLGDVARSPRMQYHALAMATSQTQVDLIGYTENALPPAIRYHALITCHRLSPFLQRYRQCIPQRLYLLYSLFNVAKQFLQLLWCLLVQIRKPDIILVQTPPAIPTLFVVLVASRLRQAKVVIDWHNFGYAMLALRLGRRHPIVRLAHWYEATIGRRADAHFCVSRAMQTVLSKRWNISATLFYDRPADQFAPTPPQVRRDLWRRLSHNLSLPAITFQPEAPDRPAIIVSSTSWTADEDFALLIDAAIECDTLIREREQTPAAQPFPSLLILITGKGPLRNVYEKQIECLRLDKIHLCTLWLEAEDYPLLMGAADLGLCLHRSASGLDIPMKVADMLGCGLPVGALDYGPCLHEILQHGENGMFFSTSTQLAHLLYDLFKDFPGRAIQLNGLRHNIKASQRRSWTDEWNAHARPAFTRP